MNRLIYVPQYPSKMRYSEWFLPEFTKQFESSYDNVIILGKDSLSNIHRSDKEMFSPIDEAIKFELEQIDEFLDLQLDNKTDTLFLADISFPGLFVNSLYHRQSFINNFCYCHATSKNYLDYFEKVRYSKWMNETSQSKMFKKVFLATEYHKRKLGWDNTYITSLPSHNHKYYKNEKKIRNIISVARPTPQKVDEKIEFEIEYKYGKIERSNFNNWNDYYKFIGESKILISTANEETFGFQILDAINNNCVPIAPNNYSYPELLPREYLYDNIEELISIIDKILNGELKVPKLLDENLINSFFFNIIDIMKSEV